MVGVGYTFREFTIGQSLLSASSSNTRSKTISKWHDCLINELLWQIISYQ